MARRAALRRCRQVSRIRFRFAGDKGAFEKALGVEDEIVAFAEVEKFIDTPVKRYSSGMHMRLAFAVAAHLEPEIMLIDEVLAVG